MVLLKITEEIGQSGRVRVMPSMHFVNVRNGFTMLWKPELTQPNLSFGVEFSVLDCGIQLGVSTKSDKHLSIQKSL